MYMDDQDKLVKLSGKCYSVLGNVKMPAHRTRDLGNKT